MLKPIKTLYQTSDVRALDEIASAEFKIPSFTLMQRAGAAAFQVLRQKWPQAKRLQVLCGKGNNAGDGYMLAKLAHDSGMQAEILYLTAPDALTGDAHAAAILCKEANILMRQFAGDVKLTADVVIDGLLGTGIKGEVSGEFKQAIERVNQAQAEVLALDLPSGLDGDSGNVLGAAIIAKATITFGGVKQGLFTGMAADYCGELFYDDLDFPFEIFAKISLGKEIISKDEIYRNLPRRNRVAHKGWFGHVLVVGGDYGMAGAARMAGEAAARSGAGLTTVATRPEHVVAVSGQCPEIMCYGLGSSDQLSDLIARSTVIVLGPGLGRSVWSENLFAVAILAKQPKIVDADGLNFVATHSLYNDNWILTPHPGEAARMLNCDTEAIQNDRFAAVGELQRRYGGVIVLKGSGTIVYGSRTGVCVAGNPGMASGGMGDVLSGILGGLVAQGVDLESAARIGVLVHSLAADQVAEKNGERGLLATDILVYVRNYLNSR